ncbi:LuxR C-terminal-related transcriptional regulator [Pseudomonas asplenii]|uniref:Regulatory protein, luxR family n=1 Tax=Pseudomonas asplenii TaxID=53407 RepID=A0A1H6P7I0_9PSED|nr:LuxR C-terminal-related transcriptional regulator [Pseudomonas fuscovaginae]SEI23652.1 regulatory protein, luxR family [Pseudomonas fuscovaginae]
MEFVTCGSWRGLLGHGLAERELSCLLAVAAGHTDKEIARQDGLSPRSIQGRISSAMHKLGVYRRPALVAEAMRRGLISIAATPPVAPDPKRQASECSGVFIA